MQLHGTLQSSFDFLYYIVQLYTNILRLLAASQVQASAAGSSDLLGGSAGDHQPATEVSSKAFDAAISIGVLIKGETMHFEYISESVSHGLMRVGLDTGVPVIFGVLTVLTEPQAEARSGLIPDGHNHGNDWAAAAVELGLKQRQWAQGKMTL